MDCRTNTWGDVLADAADVAFVAFYRDGNFFEDEVVFFVHFIARGDDQVGAGGFDRFVGRSRFDGTDGIQTQTAQATALTAVADAIRKLGVATKLEDAEQDVDRRLAGDGVTDGDVCFQVCFDGAVDRRRRLAVVVADAAACCRNNCRQGEELQKRIQEMFPYFETLNAGRFAAAKVSLCKGGALNETYPKVMCEEGDATREKRAWLA